MQPRFNHLFCSQKASKNQAATFHSHCIGTLQYYIYDITLAHMILIFGHIYFTLPRRHNVTLLVEKGGKVVSTVIIFCFRNTVNWKIFVLKIFHKKKIRVKENS